MFERNALKNYYYNKNISNFKMKIGMKSLKKKKLS